MVRLEEVRQEQARAIMTLEAIPKSGANDAMIPLGGGVQIIADIPSEAGAVIDIGSGIQARRRERRHWRFYQQGMKSYYVSWTV